MYQAVGLEPYSVMSSAQPNSTAETVRTQELVHVFVKYSVSTSTHARSLARRGSPKISKNNFACLYRAEEMLSMLFSAYRCFADSFLRFCVGKDSPARSLARSSRISKYQGTKRFTLKFFPATTAALCIAITNSFQHYLLGIGLLRTRAGDTVVYVHVGLGAINNLECSKFLALVTNLLVLTCVGAQM